MVAGRPSGPALSTSGKAAEDRLLCRLSDLPDGRSKGFDPLREGRDTMLVVRHGIRLFGYRNACPHYDFARMAWKKDEFLTPDGAHIRCSAHGALFRIEDGICEIGPCIGDRLSQVALDVRGDEVWLVDQYEPGLRHRRSSTGAES